MGKKERKNNIIRWSDTTLKEKPKEYSWSEDAFDYDGNLIFRLYYDNNKNGVYLHDITNDVIYQVPQGAKSKGYLLAFKLYSK